MKSVCYVRLFQCKQITEIDERRSVRFHSHNCKLRFLRAWSDVVHTEKNRAQQNVVLAEQHSIL